MIERDFTNAPITKLGFTVTPVTPDHFEIIAADISSADRHDLGRTWRNDWRAELRATLENATEAYMFHNQQFPFAGVFGVTRQTPELAMAWMLQSARFLAGAEEALGPSWPIKFTAMTRRRMRSFLTDYGTFFNFIPVSQTRNVRWLTGCGFTFHTHPNIETDMRLFTLGPDGKRIANDPDFWTDYLGADFADIWGD